MNNNQILIFTLQKLNNDKEKFIEIVRFLKINEYTSKDISEILGVTVNTLKKYLSLKLTNENKFIYNIPIYIKKICTFYLQLPNRIWGDDIKSETISYKSSFHENNNQFISPQLQKILSSLCYAYSYSSTKKNYIHKGEITIKRNGTFLYSHIHPKTKKELRGSGEIIVKVSLVLFVAQNFHISFSLADISEFQNIIKAFITTHADKDGEFVTKRVLLSKDRIESNAEKLEYLGDYEEHYFDVICK